MDESEAQNRLDASRAAWDARAPGWNERNLKGWDTEETAAWWRDEWLAEVRPFLPAPGPEVRLLDAGCGNGQLSVLYAKEGYTVRGCDFSLNMAQYAKENAARYGLVAPQIEFTCASIDALPYAKGEFDVVNCRCVLDFTPRPAFALRELRRVLKPGGKLVLVIQGASSPVKYQRWKRFLQGIDPIADQLTDLYNGILPWEVEQLMPVLGFRLLHQSGGYGPSGSGIPNQFAAAPMADYPQMLQQAVATAWLMVAEAVEPQPLES